MYTSHQELIKSDIQYDYLEMVSYKQGDERQTSTCPCI